MSYNEWLDIDVLEDYLDGKLDAKAMHQVEKLSLEDPFVAEALAGLSQSPRRTQSLSLLQKQLQERVAQKPGEQRRWRITSQRLSIAATAAVLFVTVSLLFWMKENKRQELLASQPKKIDINIAPEAATTKPGVKETPQAQAAIDQALADAKSNTLANNTKSKFVENKEIQSVAAAPSLARKAPAQTNTSTKERQLNEITVVATAPAPDRNALSGRVAGLSLTQAPVKVTGKVTNEDGEPIIGASVQLRAGNITTHTNAKGEFVLNLDSNLSKQKLAIGSLGFKQKEVEIKANEPLHVALEQNANALSEVVVTGYGSEAKKVSSSVASSSQVIRVNPEPAIGQEKFEQYLLDNNKLLKDKTTTGRAVQLSFTVNDKGRPVEIKVTSALTKAENEEAIRLIKAGPDWVVPAKSATTVTVNVKF